MDLDEYVKFRHPEQFLETHSIVTQEELERLDKDKDNAVSLEEYIG